MRVSVEIVVSQAACILHSGKAHHHRQGSKDGMYCWFMVYDRHFWNLWNKTGILIFYSPIHKCQGKLTTGIVKFVLKALVSLLLLYVKKII